MDLVKLLSRSEEGTDHNEMKLEIGPFVNFVMLGAYSVIFHPPKSDARTPLSFFHQSPAPLQVHLTPSLTPPHSVLTYNYTQSWHLVPLQDSLVVHLPAWQGWAPLPPSLPPTS